MFAEKGYTLVVPDPYAVPAEDFTQQITKFKSEGCEIICGTNDPPWFSNFLTQSLQQGFKPKFISSGKALIFPQAVMSYPNQGLGLIGEVAWHPSWKIKDTLSDLDSEGLAADYEAKTGQQWTAAIGCYGKFEWAIDVYKRATNPEDKESVIDAIKTTKNTFQQGHIDFTEPVDPNSVPSHRQQLQAVHRRGAVGQGHQVPHRDRGGEQRHRSRHHRAGEGHADGVRVVRKRRQGERPGRTGPLLRRFGAGVLVSGNGRCAETPAPVFWRPCSPGGPRPQDRSEESWQLRWSV